MPFRSDIHANFPKLNCVLTVQLTKIPKVGMKPGKSIYKEFEDKGFDVRKFIIQLLKIPEPIKNRGKILSFLKPH